MTHAEEGDLFAHLRRDWLAVLDELERSHRTAWLALFDARLASLQNGNLVLDFADRDKFAGAHTFDVGSRPDFLAALSDAIQVVIGVNITVSVQSLPR